ncbi:hypothetical protein Tco_0390800 [Tanacetum coccineum]
MAGSGTTNVIARCVIDEIAKFSGETKTPKYMKVFILQEIAESRRFIRFQREEAQSARSSLAQRIGEDKLRGLNETIVAAKEEISTLESHPEIMDAAINSE